MNHRRKGRRFNRRHEHRKAMFANMATALLHHEQIVTTLPKAKDLRRVIDKLITKAKKGDLTSRRLAIAEVRDVAIVRKLFDKLAPRYANRQGGYTRIMKAGFRYGDSASMAVIELVDRDQNARGKPLNEEAEGKDGAKSAKASKAKASDKAA